MQVFSGQDMVLPYQSNELGSVKEVNKLMCDFVRFCSKMTSCMWKRMCHPAYDIPQQNTPYSELRFGGQTPRISIGYYKLFTPGGSRVLIASAYLQFCLQLTIVSTVSPRSRTNLHKSFRHYATWQYRLITLIKIC